MSLKEPVDEAVGRAQEVQSSTFWWCGAPELTRRGPRAATCGGTIPSTRRRPEHTPEAFDSEHPLFLLYTSGTTGKPKGIMHTSGGYLTQASYTHYNVFDIKPETDVYWCTADIGWVTGHTYIVYGPLSNGVTQVVYEGTPNSPNEHRHFEVIEKYGVTIYYTAPTLIRMFMKWGREIPDAHDLSSLRLLGSRRRADQPRGMALVPGCVRRQPNSDRRHLVADRDRRDHDLAAARRHGGQARVRR